MDCPFVEIHPGVWWCPACESFASLRLTFPAAPHKMCQAAAINPTDKPCFFLGDASGKTTVCETCSQRGQFRLKLFDCQVFGECTLETQVGETPCCKSCPKYEAR